MDLPPLFFDRSSFVKGTALFPTKALMAYFQTKSGRELLTNDTSWMMMGLSSLDDALVGLLPLFSDRLRAVHDKGGVMEGKALSLAMASSTQIQSNSDRALLTAI